MPTKPLRVRRKIVDPIYIEVEILTELLENIGERCGQCGTKDSWAVRFKSYSDQIRVIFKCLNCEKRYSHLINIETDFVDGDENFKLTTDPEIYYQVSGIEDMSIEEYEKRQKNRNDGGN